MGYAQLRWDMLECQGDELSFKLKVDLPWHGKSERVLTHCTLGVPLKCQASVERLVATRSQTAPDTNMG